MKKKILAFAALNFFLAFPFHSSQAAEKLTPFQPGVSTGVPLAVLPPPNIYLLFDTNIHGGPLSNYNGQHVVLNTKTISNTVRLLFVPGWNFFGARYAAAVTQVYEVNNTHYKATDTDEFTSGFFNTIITPEILSLKITQHSYIAQSIAISLPDGRYDHDGPKTTAYAFANNYVTFEPSLSYSYIGNGWNITLSNIYDFNTKNTATSYHSGQTYYLDWTIAHQFGKWGVGLVGNYTQQITPDTQFGKEVANVGGHGYGNKYMYASIGPMLSYKLGKTTIMIRYLQNIAGRNGVTPSFLHIGFSLPLT